MLFLIDYPLESGISIFKIKKISSAHVFQLSCHVQHFTGVAEVVVVPDRAGYSISLNRDNMNNLLTKSGFPPSLKRGCRVSREL